MKHDEIMLPFDNLYLPVLTMRDTYADIKKSFKHLINLFIWHETRWNNAPIW